MRRSSRARKSINYREVVKNKLSMENSDDGIGTTVIEANETTNDGDNSDSETNMRRSSRARKSINYREIVENKLSMDKSDDGIGTTVIEATNDGDDSDSDSSSDEDPGYDGYPYMKKKKQKLSSTMNSNYLAILKMDDDDEDENEYKKEREKNMQNRLNVLKSMNLHEEKNELRKHVASPIRGPVIPQKTRLSQKPRTKTSKKTEEPRKSTRLSLRSAVGLNPDLNGAVNGPEEEEEKPIPIEENLSLFNYDEDKDFMERIKKEINVSYDSVSDFTTCDYDKFSEIVQSCHMFNEPQKIIPSRITSLDFHSSENKLLLVCGDKQGHLSLWDIAANQGITLQAHQYSTHCVSFSKVDSSKFYSTALDGTTRIGDVHNNNLSLLYTATVDDDCGETHTTWHHELNQTLMIARGDGSVKLIDLRAPNGNGPVFKCHRRSVRTVQSNPRDDNYFLTSSSTGMFGIFDLRSIHSNPQSAVLLEDLGKGLTSAFYSVTGSYVLTTSNDDTIRIYDCRDHECKQLVQIPHNNHGGRWLSVFKARWQPQREDCFYVGSMLQKPKRIQAYKVDGKILHELSSPMMETYTPVVTIHPSKPIIVGGNGSGKIHVYLPFQNLKEVC